MSWHSTSPDGTISVRANTPNMQDNTTYTETNLNKDHFWNIGVDQDGHHKTIQMPSNGSDLALAAGMDGGFYIKPVSASNTRIEGFYRNVNGIYQFVPAFQTGTIAVTSTSTYVNVAAVEAHSYGLIYMFTDTDAEDMQLGFFKAGASICQSYNITTQFASSSTPGANLKFGNGVSVSGLNIRARRQSGPSATYQYRIVYWGI